MILPEITADAFYCPRDDSIVRGKDSEEGPGPDGTVLVTATCSLCGAKVYKSIYPDEAALAPPPAMPPPPPVLAPEPELAVQVEGSLFPTPGTEAYVGTVERPSSVFWGAYAKELSKKLPPEMLGNMPTVASLSWYNYLTDKQRQGFLDRFRETGTLEIPDDSFDITRRNPKGARVAAMSRTKRSAAALREASGFARILDSPEMVGLASHFWSAREYEADYEDMRLTVRLRDWVSRPFEKGAEKSRAKGEIHEVRATVGGPPVASLEPLWPGSQEDVDEGEPAFVTRPERYMRAPPVVFKLTLSDTGYYSHAGFRSFVRHPSPLLAAAIERILMSAPVGLGHISLKDDFIDYHPDGWKEPQPLKLLLRDSRLVEDKKFLAPFWKSPVIRKGKELPELPVQETDLERIQLNIDAKETEFNRYIDKLYRDDVELGKKLDLSPLGVARLMGDAEYEQLLKRRDELMWAELPA